MLLLPVVIFILGLLIGSFLNVVIFRLGTGQSVVTGRSKCARCARALEWYELVPVISFLALRGKCRTCKLPISFQYPLVELATAILFVAFYVHIPLAAGFTIYSWLWYGFTLIITSLLIVISVYDVRHKIIPDLMVYIFIFLSILAIVVKSTFAPGPSPIGSLMAGVLVALPFFLLWAFSRGRVMGFGDVKLALGIGWLLGLSAGFAAVIISFWIGAIVGLFLLALSRTYSMKSQIPFGPFLAAGTLIVSLWGITMQTIMPLWQ